MQIPFDQWAPITVPEVVHQFAGAPFKWGLAGGHAIEQFLGRTVREHKDIDVLVLRQDQLLLQRWLTPDWQLFAADPPGLLRQWQPDEYLHIGIHDVWAHRKGIQFWQLQIMLMETEGNRWYSRRDPRVGGNSDQLIVLYGSVPCIRVEVQLLFKSKNHREKDDVDFEACLPQLSGDAKLWLGQNLQLLNPEGHP